MKVSIITATYNSEENIEKCLNSIFNQKYKDIEVILVDGESSDKTIETINLKFGKFKNLKLISEPDNGIYDALNKGIKNSSGEIIGFLHSDDFFPNDEVISSIVDKIKKEKSHGLYANLNYVNSKNPDLITRVWIPSKFKKYKLKFGWMAPHPTIYLSKQIYDQVGLFNTKYRISSDYDFILRLFKNDSFKINYLDKTVTHMKVGGASNKNLKNLLIKYKEDLDIIKKHKLHGYITLAFKNIRKIDQYFR